MQQIKFNQTDLLNYNEIDLLIRSDFPNERAMIITNKLKNYIFIFENIVYVFNKDTITYKQIEDSLIILLNFAYIIFCHIMTE